MKKAFLISILFLILAAGCIKKPPETTPEVYTYVEAAPSPEIKPEDFSPPIPEKLPEVPQNEAQKIKRVIEKEKRVYEYPIEINDLVKRFIYAYTTKYRKFMEDSLRRSGKYIDFIKRVFKKEGIPVEIAYLPIIESGFKEKAMSYARARGMWQFMRSTGRLFGLQINWWVDERLDPIRSTYAAAKYLKYLYNRLGDWNLALAAYNGGTRRVERGIRRTGTRDFWKIKRYLRRQTANYVPAFIATVIIATNREDYGFSNETEPPFKYDEVEVPSPTDLRVIAKCAGISYSTIRAFNPHILRFTTPGNLKTYTVRIPPGTKQAFLENFNKLSSRERLKWTWYRVNKGDSLYRISRKFRVPISAIKDANNMKYNLIHPGQRLLIPLSYSYSTKTSSRVRTSSYRTSRTKKLLKGERLYTVKPGDTIYSIARKYGVSQTSLKRRNGLWRNLIKPGQKLIIPASKPRSYKKQSSNPTKIPPGAILHTVKKGETLYYIARKYNVSVQKIKKWNSLRSNIIKPGQKLVIYK